MIVMLALLNDGAILSIAYDNVRYRNAPEAWNMRLVLGIATVLGLVGPIAAFGLFFLGDRVFELEPSATSDNDVPDAVGRRAFDDLPDTYARPVVVHTPGLDPVGGSMRDPGCGNAGCGLWRGLVTPLGWRYAGIVWGYAFAWFLVTDPVKLLAYKVLDAVKADTEPQANAGLKPGADAEPPRNAEVAPETDGKSAPAPETRAEIKPEPQVSLKAESEPTAKADTKPKPDVEPSPEATVSPEAEAKSASTPTAKGGVETLVNTTLGELLLAGVLKHPEEAGHIIADAIVEAEASIDAERVTKAELKPEAKITASSTSTSRVPT